MKITIITLFPKMIEGFIADSIIKRAQNKGLVEINLVNLRDFARDSYGTVDERPYGGGAGMVLCVDVLKKSLDSITTSEQKPHIVLTSAKGSLFNQKKAQDYSQLKHLVIYAGHYEGFDERFSDYIDEEVSLGDFIMTGGELTAATICDAIVRLLPGVLKKENATTEESFFICKVEDLQKIMGDDLTLSSLQKKGIKEIRLLEYPQYTRPEEFEGKKVPEILLSGDPKKIKAWQLKKAFELTLQRRPDLLDK
ncbi:MAG: tRNA (guanosine(37)-N1)-methyltransferase TrmD [Candidatus Roizmanbacteria bacterium]|nr:tRNA (guanosine(37)-N1)-methyltransferase TrmD [Candidatus Roizmanbacteria bacterium]